MVFGLLMNLAQNNSVLTKIVKRGIVGHLLQSFKRGIPVNIVNLEFLKLLSVFKECKDEILENASMLLDGIDGSLTNESTRKMALNILGNLCHDPEFSQITIEHKISQILLKLLQKRCELPLTLKTLYQISMHKNTRLNILFSDINQVLLSLTMEYNDFDLLPCLLPLMINLSITHPFTVAISRSGGIKQLARRGFNARNPLILKCLANISFHDDQSIKQKFLVS